MQDYDFSEEDAVTLLEPEGVKNEQLEILQSLSPLLANKLVEKLSEEEIRTLLNL